MSSVWYIGEAIARIIRAEDWTAAGHAGEPEVRWDSSNGYSQPQSAFTAGQLTLLDADDAFSLTATDGPRPGAIVAPGREVVTRGYVEEKIQQSLDVFGGQLDFIPATADAGDTQAAATRRISFTDASAAKGSVVDVWHWGDGSGNAGMTYGVDIHNGVGAKAGLVLHQYSNNGAAIQLDNTDSSPMISIKNTNNPVKNPDGAAAGTSATGAFLQFTDSPGNPLFSVLGRGEILSRPGVDAAGHAIEIVGAANGKRLIKTTMNGAGTGVEIVAGAGSVGFFPLLVSGQDYGPQFQTSADGSGRFALHVAKNGVGLGDGLKVTNKGTGKSVLIANATGNVAQVNADGEVEILTAGKGILAKSPDGTRYRLVPPNGGGAATWVAAP